MPYVVGVDTGGTFTDVVVVDEEGAIITGKAPTTPKSLAKGVENALTAVADNMQTTVENILEKTKVFCFGTTIGTNAIATRAGVKTGMLTTAGARDVTYIARGMSKWGGLPEAEVKHVAANRRPEPFVTKDLIKEVNERVDWKGSIVCKMSPPEVERAVKSLVEQGVDSIAICFLWSFQNNTHEKEAKRIIAKLYPNIYCSASYEVAPVQGEYERFMTTIFDCYVGPVTKTFLESLRILLQNRGLKTRLVIMKADGGSAFSDEVLPVATVHSGPAGGVIGARYLGELLGHGNIVSGDVGGTTFDVSVIRNGKVPYSREPIIEKHHTLYPTVDVISIGAGGGTIIWANQETGTLHVGPKSAGANPGPACYGFGGVEPTITDANLVLGYINPEFFLGGTMKLDRDAAVRAIGKVSSQVGMDITQTAAGAYDIINAHMSDLITGVTVRRGYDVREFVFFCFGGAGPLHAAEIGVQTGVKEIIVPEAASEYSAIGLATSSLLQTRVRYKYSKLPMDMNEFSRCFEELEAAVSFDLEQDEVKEEDRSVRYFLEMKYGLQLHTVRVEIPRRRYGIDEADWVASEFDKVYEDLYGKGAGYPAAGRVITTFIVTGESTHTKLMLRRCQIRGADASSALKTRRDAFFRKYNGYVATNIYDYRKLESGNIFDGPAIVEAPDTTLLIPPDQRGYVDEYRNIRIKWR